MIAFGIYWLICGAVIVVLVLTQRDSATSDWYSWLQLGLPGISLFVMFFFERALNYRVRGFAEAIVRRCFAVPFLVLGMNWLVTFVFTDYREHFRLIIIPLGVIFLFIGLALTHVNIYKNAKPGASPNGDPATSPGNSGVTDGPQSVS